MWKIFHICFVHTNMSINLCTYVQLLFLLWAWQTSREPRLSASTTSSRTWLSTKPVLHKYQSKSEKPLKSVLEGGNKKGIYGNQKNGIMLLDSIFLYVQRTNIKKVHLKKFNECIGKCQGIDVR